MPGYFRPTIFLTLMLLAGRKYLNVKLLNSLSALTYGVKEISAGNFEKKLYIHTGDEVQTLAEDFNVMTDELKNYMTNLTRVIAEKERFTTEFDVVMMKAAKEVGGDLYDFYKFDENHLFVTIADFSGKGVPAAITNLRNFAASLKSLDDLKGVIEKTNDRLCANNNDGLFVTALRRAGFGDEEKILMSCQWD